MVDFDSRSKKVSIGSVAELLPPPGLLGVFDFVAIVWTQSFNSNTTNKMKGAGDEEQLAC
jgi:hypothetical protein